MELRGELGETRRASEDAVAREKTWEPSRRHAEFN